jgi:hypothetical protein
MNFSRKWCWLIPIIPVLGLVGFLAWAGNPLGPMPEALEALESDSQVQVEIDPWLVFRPLEVQPAAGLIFYPGGRVDPRSYAPPARVIAEQGYLVVIVSMPLNLALFSPGRAAEVIAAYPEICSWTIGGHSLGGAMAANFARQNLIQVQGLFFWASYPASSDDLSKLDLEVVSVFGTLDGLSTLEKIEFSRPLLPANTHWVAIQGGNHARFGWYGEQPGDNPATISRASQQSEAVRATLDLLSQVGE